MIEADKTGEVPEGESVNLHAYGVDAKGNRIALDPTRLHWSVGDPRSGRFDLNPLAPSDPASDWIGFNAKYHEEVPVSRLWVTYGTGTIFVELYLVKNSFVVISAGQDVTCAVRKLGNLSCWGGNVFGMLGLGRLRPPDRCRPTTSTIVDCTVRPMAVSGTRLYSTVSVGGGHVCALEAGTGAAYCWGTNSWGQLGVPKSVMTSSYAPVAVSPPAGSSTPLAFQSISAGVVVSCGVTTANQEYCWGIGWGEVPVQQINYTPVFSSSAAEGLTCRHWTSGIRCDSSPNVISHTGTWSFLGQATTAHHVCAIDSANATWCWGENFHGQLGNGVPIGGRTPVTAPATLTTVATGGDHSCGLAGTVAYCWGMNNNGELGANSVVASSSSPLLVTNGPATPHWRKISTGLGHTCAIDSIGDAWCWGKNYSGQLGIGTKINFNASFPRLGVYAPAKVVGP